MSIRIIYLCFFASLLTACAFERDKTLDDKSALTPTFSSIQTNILNKQCTVCHSASGQASDLPFQNYTQIMGENIVVAGDPANSDLYQQVSQGFMPLGGTPLSADQLAAIKAWIAAGALDN